MGVEDVESIISRVTLLGVSISLLVLALAWRTHPRRIGGTGVAALVLGSLCWTFDVALALNGPNFVSRFEGVLGVILCVAAASRLAQRTVGAERWPALARARVRFVLVLGLWSAVLLTILTLIGYGR